MVESITKSNLMSYASALTYSSILAAVPVLAIVFAVARGFGFGSLIEDKLRESLHHYHQPLGGTQPPPFHRCEFLLVDAPDIVQVRHGYCLGVCLLLFIYIMCAALRRAVCCLAEKDSRPVSRVLYAPQCGGACHLSSADVTISLYRSTLRLGRAALSMRRRFT